MEKDRGSRKDKPLIYSCSGCSSAAQMANDIALRIRDEGIAEMSCIAGVGGDVPSLVKVAKSGRDIIALDGCILQCVKSCLNKQNVEPTIHHIFADYEVKKRKTERYDKEEAEAVYQKVVLSIREAGVGQKKEVNGQK